MIIVSLKGGLGNQMFQYAAGRRLAEVRGTALLLDCAPCYTSGGREFALEWFNIQATCATAR